jgi:N-hydroxyarylamine O-acetyltransferase
MDMHEYLERICFSSPIIADKKTLYSLQKKHLLNIPFENLDIHYKKKISLSIDVIYKKIVIDKRGGFCYELNGLFHRLLVEMGFHAKLISARVHTKNGQYSPEFDHLAIIVNLENQEFLVDVGFGKFSFEPLKLELDTTINDNFGQFRFDRFERDHYRINEIKGNDSFPQYIFTTKRRELFEFEKRCEFHQTSHESHFTKKKLISIAKENGRITLNNSQLKITSSGIEEEIEFEENEFEDRLKQLFNIEIVKGSCQ